MRYRITEITWVWRGCARSFKTGHIGGPVLAGGAKNMACAPKKRRKPSRVVKSTGIQQTEAELAARPVSSMPDIRGALEAARRGGFAVTPLQLLGVILKSVLKNRITDEEVDRISAVYYDTIQKWWD